jgi:membrane protein DedA with SNARE-associated domain
VTAAPWPASLTTSGAPAVDFATSSSTTPTSLPLSLLVQAADQARPLISHLADLWAYTALGGTSIVTEEVAPIVGGFAAAQGHLGLKRVILAIAVGSWAATTLLYFLGRWRGRWARKRWPSVGRYMKRALRAVRARPWRSALVVRFAFGARLLLPLACGAAHVPLPVYLVGTAVSSVVWAVAFTMVGWAFGETAVTILGRVRRYDDYLALALVFLVGAVYVVLRRRRRLREAAAAAERGPELPDTPEP